jgi:hypothetical protein
MLSIPVRKHSRNWSALSRKPQHGRSGDFTDTRKRGSGGYITGKGLKRGLPLQVVYTLFT